ncbi:zinc ribbon domain-containing protein [Phycisphaerales bacterium AB-hyl4]|uniref:Zinc ribbon domain-containing protein n=1 Tax=Natronomicrosphaera hydrolytica TaxID=3242702 RepID=A0ABV4U969_9BACT
MPIYEYTCQRCQTTTEALRKMADADAQLACEACGSTDIKRRHSTFATRGESSKDVSLPMGPGCGCGNPQGPCNMR